MSTYFGIRQFINTIFPPDLIGKAGRKMAKETGVYQLENGCWGFRFHLEINGKPVDIRRVRDENGQQMKTASAAEKARTKAIAIEKERRTHKPITRITVNELWKEYVENGRKDKAYGTLLKQDSLWKNHIKDRFGKRMVDEISVAEVNDYLAELYYDDGLSFKYTESFLKIFYLIFGQAYSRGYLANDDYCKLCKNKDTKIHMPKLKSEDDLDIVSYNKKELRMLDDYFDGTNAETAYLLGRYCGLRINECYGIKWDHVDLDNGTIRIDRQMQYQNGIIKLVPPKTLNGKRTLYIAKPLLLHLKRLKAEQERAESELREQREQNQTFITDLDGEKISSLELVNCLPNGKIQTVNSMKFHSRTIKSDLGIDFKFHHLRHTYGTRLAEMNTPTHILMNQMGHGNIHITQKYYLAVSQDGIQGLMDNLNKM